MYSNKQIYYLSMIPVQRCRTDEFKETATNILYTVSVTRYGPQSVGQRQRWLTKQALCARLPLPITIFPIKHPACTSRQCLPALVYFYCVVLGKRGAVLEIAGGSRTVKKRRRRTADVVMFGSGRRSIG